MEKWKHVLQEKIQKAGAIELVETQEVDLSKVPDDQIWDGLPKHLRNKKKVTYIRNHSDLKVSSRTSKFMLLLWKDWVTMKRRWISTLVEVLTPVIAIALLTISVAGMRPDGAHLHSHYRSFGIKSRFHAFTHCDRFIFIPNTKLARDLKDMAAEGIGNGFNFLMKDSHDLDESDKYKLCAVIDFNKLGQKNADTETEIFPTNIHYTIRMPAVHRVDNDNDNGEEHDDSGSGGGFLSRGAQWHTEHKNPSELITGPRNEMEVGGGSPGYYNEGFLYLQNLVAECTMMKIYVDGHASYSTRDDALKAFHTLTDRVDFQMNRFPYPANRDDRLVEVIHDVLPLTIVVSYLIPFMLIVYGSVVQKESGIRYQMKAMIPINYHRVVWIIRCLLLHISAVLAITAILGTNWTYNGTGVLKFTDPTIFFLMMLAYLFKTITTSMFLAVFFKRATTATATCSCMWIISYIPYFYVKSNYNSFGKFWQRALACILGNTAISLGCHIISDGEARGRGVTWDNIFEGEFSVGFVVLIMFAGGCFEIVFSWYLSRIIPDKGIRSLPWHYCFHPWYWRGLGEGDDATHAILHLLNAQSLEDKFPDNFEQDTHLRRRKELQLEKVSKYFGTDRILNKINLNCYEGHLTAIIGEEGCGKSTLLSIVGGLASPTSGSIVVSRQDMGKQMKNAIAFVGYSCSDNILYPHLTVEETLLMYCQLKCIRTRLEIWDEVNRFINDAMLHEYRHSRIYSLTKSAKRIVMVACAFIGGSRVVLLDDPTRNMNAAQKRITWDFVQRQKKHRTIVVAMDCMNESDTVVDRIVCLQHGEANTAGSIRFLQLRYGGGYHLIIQQDVNKCDVKAIRDLVKRRVQDSHLANEEETSLDFYLPEDQSSSFPGLLEELDKKKGQLGIFKVRTSYITMDEVLMNIKRIAMETDYDPDHRKAIYSGVEEVQINPNYRKLRGYPYVKAQFRLLLMKNIKFTIRRKKIFFATTLSPMILVFLCCLIFYLKPLEVPQKPLNFNFDFYVENATSTKPKISPKLLIDCHNAIYEGNYICSHLKKSVGELSGANVTRLFRKSITQYVLEMYRNSSADSDIPLVGIEVGTNSNPEKSVEMTGFFNNQPLHVPPLALLVMDNALMAYIMGALTALYPQYGAEGEIKPREHRFSVTNHPLEYTAGDKVKFSGIFISPGFFLGVFVSLGFALLVASFVILEVQEKSYKHLQMLAGAHPVLFWAANYCWNFFHFTVVSIVLTTIIAVFQFFQEDNGFGWKETLTLFILLEVYGLTSVFFVGSWSIIPVDKWGMAFSRTYLFLIFTGPLCMLGIIVMSDPNTDTQMETIAGFHNIFLVFPSYAVAMGVFYVIANSIHNAQCGKLVEFQGKTPCEAPDKIFRHPWNEFERKEGYESLYSCCINRQTNPFAYIAYGVGRNIQFMLSVALISLVIRIMKESAIWTRLKIKITKWQIKHWEHHDSFEHEIYDYDVLNETLKVQHGDNIESDLVIKNLSKELRGGKRVDNLCIHVSKGQCFCLLGVAGAGKTAAVRMIAGSRFPTSGDVTINGISLMKNYYKYIKKLGYCPDEMSFLEELTGHEVLELIGTLRRIPHRELDGFITNLSLRLLFLHDLGNPIQNYNAISVRKLSAAVAMLGDPDVIVFDEPTHSIDLISREYLFTCINQLVEKGKIVIISSKSVAEVESVCSDMAIMVNGTLRCFGTPHHLRSLFSEGFTIIVKFELDAKKIYFTTKKDKYRVHQRRAKEKKEVVKGPTKRYLNERSTHRSVGDISLFPERASESAVEVEKETEHDMMLTTWEEDLIPLVEYFERNFPESILVDKQPGFVHYHIRERYANAATLFTKMEEAKVVVSHIETYYIGESNLDQVFINFSRGQKPQD